MISSDSPSAETYPPGTLRYTAEDGTVFITRPRDPLYATTTLLATEYWSPTASAWISLNVDDADHTSSFST